MNQSHERTSLWVTLLGFVAPLVTLAGSAVAFVWKVYRDREDQHWNRFLELMKLIDSKDLPIATKCAAIYQLRHFAEHKEFILRSCAAVEGNVESPAMLALVSELHATRDALIS